METAQWLPEVTTVCRDEMKAIPNCVPTVKPCVFPFIFEGAEYHTCINNLDVMGRYWCVTEIDRYGEKIKGQWGYCVQAPESEMPPEAIVIFVLLAFLLLGCIGLLGFRIHLFKEKMKAKREYQKNPWTESQGDVPDLKNRETGRGFLKRLRSWKRKDRESDASSSERPCDDVAEAPATRIGSTSSSEANF